MLKENPFQLDIRRKYAVAISGGSDSLAMLLMLIDFGFKECITVLHYNHNLRNESEKEADWIRKWCENHGIRFLSEKWVNPKLEANIQQEARQARYAFFKQESERENFDAVLVGHTKDDVVETMLMRLGRGSGLSGLSAMQKESNVFGVKIVRPLLDFSREELQTYLDNKNQEYISDPSNENKQFFRIRVRNLKPALKEAGLNYEHIAASAHALRRSDDALNFFVDSLANQLIEENESSVQLSSDIFMYPEEVQLRLLAKALFAVTDDGLAPRTSKRQQALFSMQESVKKFTLGGAIFKRINNAYLLEKE